jgi:oxalate decarboxylase
MAEVKRRDFIAGGAAGALAGTAAGLHPALAAMGAAGPEPIRGEDGATILGPRNVPLERENPDQLAPPSTDNGLVPNLKFSFDAAHNRLTDGGWAREVTARELPVATEMAGVDMRLKPGAIRELHWHLEAEWSFMLAGSARLTAVDPKGRNFIADVGVGDLWYFPPGIPHSIQGLAGGCEFLLVFDDGDFSENNTFLLTDWITHTPPEVLAKNFGVSEAAFAKVPPNLEQQRYIFPAEVPPPLRAQAVRSPQGTVPHSFKFRLADQAPVRRSKGQVRIVDAAVFPASTHVAAAIVDLEPGGIRELHWHPNADEWQYWVEGRGRMSVFASSGNARTFDFQAGDVGYVPKAMGHYIENTGTTPVRFLEMFRSDRYQDVSLAQWLGLVPRELVREHLPVGQRLLRALPRTKPVIN